MSPIHVKVFLAERNQKNAMPWIILFFIFYSDAVDDVGHHTYWGSDVYYEIVRQKDAQVAAMLNSLATTKTSAGNSMLDETIVVIIADHGGYRNAHDWAPPFIATVHVPLLFKGMSDGINSTCTRWLYQF